ncbi:MAG: hypothetical protein Q607_CBUC00054G0077 [Clostridium butyricum DORA_1]|nr:MAG: hypothetical protein Q607_CBUC00054G0077 [Clostridium butyricum DORA_1]MDU1507248.1 transposase [Clostridium butyricum]MDU4799727.1 transposase [Clostridium butyricum]
MILKDSTFDKISLYQSKSLKKIIYSKENIKEYSCCPHCKNVEFIKFGKYDGIQRYRCKSCKKTFSATTNSLWKYLKHPPEKWFKFIELLGEKKTLEYCAKTLKISIVTAFNWRHKALHGIEKIYKPKEFKDLIFMEIYYSRRNYKGSRNKHFEFKCDFYKTYNIAHRDVYTVISYDVNDSLIVENVGLDRLWEKNFEDIIYDLCDTNSYIHIDPTFTKPLHFHVVNHNKKLPYKIRKKVNFNPKSYYAMDNIKCTGKSHNISVKLNNWIGDFRGVATKYLNHYCNLFSLLFVDKTFNYMDIFFELLSVSPYSSMKDIKHIHLENY